MCRCHFSAVWQSSNPRPTLATLPDDILLDILNLFRVDGFRPRVYEENKIALKCLFSISCTCRRLNRLANQILYHNIWITKSHLEARVRDFLDRNPDIRKYVRYYKGCDPYFLGGLLSYPLQLRYLSIPCSFVPPRASEVTWLTRRHEDLVVRGICLHIPYIDDTFVLDLLCALKGLKTLCLIFCHHDPPRFLRLPPFPELENLVLRKACPLDLQVILNACPKLRSLHIKFHHKRQTFEPDHRLKDVWNTLSILKKNDIFFLVENFSQGKLLCPLLYQECFQYAESAGFDPTSLIQWLTRSALFFADFYGPPPNIVFLCLTELQPLHRLQTALEGIKSLGSAEDLRRRISLGIRILGPEYVEIISSMPTSIRYLYIVFEFNRLSDTPIYDLPPRLTTRIITALPRLVRLDIVVSGLRLPNGYSYPRFTNSHFDGLIGGRKYPNLELHRGQQLHHLTPEERKCVDEMLFVELMGFFDLNSTLQEISVCVHLNWWNIC
jgi:hypothetical protein